MPQPFDIADTDEFLRFIFRGIARRPDPLQLWETARVARYLQWLAWNGVPGKVILGSAQALKDYHRSQAYEKDRLARQKVQRIADLLWKWLSEWGQVERCSKEQALRFLRRHSQTYFAASMVVERHAKTRSAKGDLRKPDPSDTHVVVESILDVAMTTVEKFEIAAPQPNETLPFEPPHLLSSSKAAQGLGNPRLHDDTSERIYAAFYILKPLQPRGLRERIAGALKKARVPRRSKRDGEQVSGWTYAAVNERVKQYEGQLREHLSKTLTPDLPRKKRLEERLEEQRKFLVELWIARFRSDQEYRRKKGVL
jgi:hypothetical protein